MKIAIDIRRITEFGVGTYTRNIVRALGRFDHTNEYFLVGSPQKVEEIGPLPLSFQTLPLLDDGTSARGYLEFRAILKRLQCDLVHIPHLFWMPRTLPCPYVMTVHDLLEHMYRTRPHSSLRHSLHQHFTRRVLKGAGRILAERYLIRYPFLLYAGSISPHKNLVRIIEAFSALKAELEKEGKFPDLKLIIIGDELSKHPDLRRTVIRSGVQNDVRFLGFIPIEMLRVFYDAAKIFVFPTLYEGFGLPPLEAMAHGTPVVTSNTSSLPEVVGNAAVLVNPENVFEIMRALLHLLLDQPVREQMKKRGYEQAKKFSWDASARRMIEVYAEVAAAPRTAGSRRPAAETMASS